MENNTQGDKRGWRDELLDKERYSDDYTVGLISTEDAEMIIEKLLSSKAEEMAGRLDKIQDKISFEMAKETGFIPKHWMWSDVAAKFGPRADDQFQTIIRNTGFNQGLDAAKGIIREIMK